jgi:predicted unusual protein kinase regulating ubiquinone biosynthesis (AarF/ABC1/UbiB family)
MEKGFFHADPHPGNLGFSDKGKLVFYDFGLVIPITEELKNGFMELLVHIINKDTKSIVDTLVRLKIIIPTADLQDIQAFFELILGYMERLDPNELMSDELMKTLADEKPFVIPSSFIYLAKTFSTIEGICLRLDDNFNYFTYLEPLIRDKITETFDVKDIITTTAEMPTRVKNISTAVLGLEKSRTAMKRSIDKTRREIRMAQYSILCAMMADRFADQENIFLFGTFFFSTLWFTFISRKNR